MATPTYALHRIRRNIREKGSAPPEPATKTFDERRAAYREILEEVHVLGGDLALDDLTDWVVRETERTGSLPDVEKLKGKAKKICDEYDVIFPEKSPILN